MKFTRIDALVRRHHYWLDENDECYFLREYTARAGFAHSQSNDLISNFKKPPERRSRPTEWHWKEVAIATAAKEISPQIRTDWLKSATLVPIPPSRIKGDPGYDDRMTQVLEAMSRSSGGLDVRELVVQIVNRDPAHGGPVRPTPASIRANYQIDESLAEPAPQVIGIFDDVLTTGCQFKAMQALLGERFPGVPIVGFFWARRVPETGASPTP